MLARLHFDVTIVQDDEVTAVVLQTEEDNPYKPTGTAKRHPKDTPNSTIGQMIALGRLFITIGEDYAKGAAQLMEAESVHGAKVVTLNELPPALKQWLGNKGVPDREL